MASLLNRFRVRIASFKEKYVTAPTVDTLDWSEQGARGLRYETLWAQYEGSSYRDIHTWSTELRKQYGLYKYIRPIYSPAWRLGEFWKAHTFGGLLDRDAGQEGAIPIETENEDLRPAIAEVWKWSRWQVQKDILTVRGAILGDAAIQVVDDVARGRVYLRLLYPGVLESVDKDAFGNVKGYVIQEARVDPRNADKTVTYREEATRDGKFVIYQTFLDGEPYAWPGNGLSFWAEPYGFIPLVVIQHNDVGLEWGWSELHPVRAKVQEADDIASMISDQVRRHMDPKWLVKGAKVAAKTTLPATTPTTDIPSPGREENKFIFLGKDADVVPMIAQLDMESAIVHLNAILKEIERDVLELAVDMETASGSASGRALRTARQPVVSKVLQRRNNYDAAMVTTQQMAISIGGLRGYDGYKGFGLDSYASGALEHSIGTREVFSEDPLDDIEIQNAFWLAAGTAKKAGVPLEAYLKEAGWDDDRIVELGIKEPEPIGPQPVGVGDISQFVQGEETNAEPD